MITPELTEPDRDAWLQFQNFANRRHCVWLDTAAGQGVSVLAADPSRVIRAKGRQIDIITPTGTQRFEADPFTALQSELSKSHEIAIGYFGYDLKNFVERLPTQAADDLGMPDLWFGFYDAPIWFESLPGTRPAPVPAASSPHPASSFTRASYRQTVQRAKDYIAAGDIYQVNLSQRFQCQVDASAADVYRALRRANPAPYCAYLDIGNAQILSSSPECFLKLEGRQVITRPIKGTRPRSVDPAELLAAPKDNAELLMIIDLERNDLGRVCEFGSVQVPELVRVESFATVHHLVATVAGTLRAGVSHVDCVRACFPGGSITGAPKIRAMEIIDELEPHARGIYTGAIGFFDPAGNRSHFNIAIRTAVYRAGGHLTFQAGGGIVADSDPDAEYDETLAKAQGIFNALNQLRLRQR